LEFRDFSQYLSCDFYYCFLLLDLDRVLDESRGSVELILSCSILGQPISDSGPLVNRGGRGKPVEEQEVAASL